MTEPHRGARVDVAPLLDEGRWTVYRKWLVFLTALTIVFDGIDNQLLGIVMPAVMREWNVGRPAFAPVVAWGYAGMMLGGALAGVGGDRFGRRTALLGSMIVFGAMTAAAALVHDTTAFAVLRFLAGLGLGGAMPNAAALAAEYVPITHRPLAVTLTIVCVPLGGTLAGLLGLRLLPLVGWRTLFIIGGVVPVVAVAALRWLLPESPRFLARHPERFPELSRELRRMGHAIPEGAIFVDRTERPMRHGTLATLFQREFLRDTAGLWGAFFSCLLAVYLVFSWLTSVLAGAGYDPAAANAGITGFNLGGVAGAILGGAAMGWFGSRRSMLTMTAAAGVLAIALSQIPIGSPAPMLPVLVLLVAIGALVNGVQVMMYALAAHVYPSAVRATGVGSAVAFGRIGAILSGYVGSAVIEAGGTRTFFLTIALAMLGTFAGLAAVARAIPPRLR